MLDMILQIFAVLGIILLVLLAVFLTIVLLVLFFPVTYHIYGKKDEEGIQGSAKVKWLFGLLRARYSYPEWGHLTIKALCFTLYDATIPGDSTSEEEQISDGTEKKKAHKAKKKKKAKEEKKTKKEKKAKKVKKTKKEKNMTAAETAADGTGTDSKRADSTGTDRKRADGTGTDRKRVDGIGTDTKRTEGIETDNKRADDIEKTGIDMVGTDANGAEAENVAEALDASEENIKAEGIGKIFLKFHKIKYTIYKIYDKIKKIWKNISYYIELLKEEETKQLFKYALFRIGNILKHIRPRHIKAYILFGTGAPDTTGYLYGAYCMVSSVMGMNIGVTPDFERAVFQGEVDVSGHITIWVLAWNGCKLFLDKKFRRLLKKLKV